MYKNKYVSILKKKLSLYLYIKTIRRSVFKFLIKLVIQESKTFFWAKAVLKCNSLKVEKKYLRRLFPSGFLYTKFKILVYLFLKSNRIYILPKVSTTEAQPGGGGGVVAPPKWPRGGRRPPPWFWHFPTQGDFLKRCNNLSVPQKNKILCKPLVIRVLSALKMRNFPVIFSKNFLEGHGPPDISVGRGVGKRGITPSLDSGGGGGNPRF